MKPDQLKARRAALDLTQAQLADLLGVSKQSVSFWEQGRRPIPGAMLDLALCELAARHHHGTAWTKPHTGITRL